MARIPEGRPVRLTAGAHSSPQEGVCVVELASVIAKERFSDRPRCVCPVIGAFLRGWNDRAPHAERQRLGPYAARIVGSRRSRQVTRERREICLDWAGADLIQDGARPRLYRARMRFRIAVFCSLGAAVRLSEGAGDYASRVAAARGDTESAFELLDSLLSVGADRPPDRPPAAVNGKPGPPAQVNGRPRTASGSDPAPNGNGSAPEPAVPAGDPLVKAGQGPLRG